MRFVKKLLGFLLVALIALAAGAYLLPREVPVARSVTINAAPEAIFPYVNSLKATQDWSPWLEIDPEVKLEFSGPDTGVGAKMTWASDDPQVGVGSQEITESVENQSVETALDFGEMGTATAAFMLTPSGSETDVVWTLNADMGNNPIGRYMGLMMDRWVGADYEKGLANLKAVVEGR